jgi:miniconductance mechanosensitive channel
MQPGNANMLDTLANIHPLMPLVAMVAALFLGAIIADRIAKFILLGLVRRFARSTAVAWDDILVEHKVFERVVHLLPAIIIFWGIDLIPDISDGAVAVIRNVMLGYMVLMLTMALSSSLTAANDIYGRTEMARDRPLKGFVQLVQLIVWILGGIMIVAAILDRSPVLLLSGFGAMTAVLLLIFKDTIMSLVASVQITAQDMVRVGDWIEMPQYGADGDVIDVQLHTIKVQNWDKTIVTVPTHKLVSESVKNWRGMTQAGGRRIKRSLHIDISTIRFQSDAEVAKFRRLALLVDYIDKKKKELADYNAGLAQEVDAEVNHRRLTNVGTFRAYAYNYLKNHPSVRDDMTLLVRQLDSGPDGLPIEIYCISDTTVWGEYEDIQSDIFDHLFAIVPEFDLKIYQRPAGTDFKKLIPAD